MYLFLGSIAFICIGSFLPWANWGMLSVNGTEGDGVITLILAIVGAVMYFAFKNKPKVVKISTIVIGALSLVIAIMSFTGIGDLQVGSPGGGLYMVTIGSIALIISPFINTSRPSTNQYQPQPTSQEPSTSVSSSFCSNCGNELTSGQFCNSCGHKKAE